MGRSARDFILIAGAALLAYALAIVSGVAEAVTKWTGPVESGELFELAVPLVVPFLVLVLALSCLYLRRLGEQRLQDRTQTARWEGEKRLHLVLRQIPAMLWTMDIELRYTSSSGSGLARLNLKSGELDGRTLDDASGARDREFFSVAAHRQALRGESAAYTFTGGGRSYQAHVEPLRDADRRIIGCIGVALDVTERVRAEETLRKNHSLLTAIVEGTLNPIFVTDTQGRYVLVNSKAAELVGKPAEEIIGKDDVASFPPELAQRIVEEDREVLATGEGGSYERVGIMVNGEERSYLNTKSVYLDHDGKPLGLVGIAHDITDRRRAEEQARRHQAELAHVARVSAVGEMASGVAHELGQPLGVILSGAELCLRLARSGAWNTAEGLGIMEDIAGQADRAGQIIKRLKTFVSKRTPQRSAVDLNRVVREAAQLAQVEAAAGRVTVRLDLAEGLPPVRIDGIQIEQVILNLMRNAVQAMDDVSAGRRRLTVRTSTDGSGGIDVAVCDMGKGLPADDRLFEPFFTTRPEGMGMGLSLSRSIIEAHGGRLWAIPNRDRGATFQFTLPVGEEANDDEHRSGPSDTE